MNGDWFDRQRGLLAAPELAARREVVVRVFIRREVHGGPLSLPGLTSQSLAARHAPLHVALWPVGAPEGSIAACVFQTDPSARTVLRPGSPLDAIWIGELTPGGVGMLVVGDRTVAPTMALGPAVPGDPTR